MSELLGAFLEFEALYNKMYAVWFFDQLQEHDVMFSTDGRFYRKQGNQYVDSHLWEYLPNRLARNTKGRI